MRYIKRIFLLFYGIFNWPFFKKSSLSAVIYPSVRIQGKKYISILSKVTIQRQGWLLALKIDENNPEIFIGENSAIGDFSHISSVRSVVIERDVLIANKVYISDNMHNYMDVNVPVIYQKVAFKAKVHIKEGAWIGENVSIIGAVVGRNSVVGANSVVTKDIPDYSLAVGIPAKVIKRFNFEKNEWVSTNKEK